MLSPILIIGDSKRYHPLFTALRDLDILVERVPSPNEGLKVLKMKLYAAVIVEGDLPHLNSLEALKQIQKIRPDTPVVALGGGSDGRIGINEQPGNLVDHLAMTGDEREDLPRLLDCLKRLFPELRARILAVRDLLLWVKTPSERMKEILTLVDILKDEPSTVLIQGENGTGKDIIARLLHFSGRRHAGQFVAINCAAIPETLLESELFGHEKGSFTGAAEKRIGKFELAHKGTAFLDEIGDMPLSTQAKILRVLERAEIERLGGHEKIPVDIRIVAATNKNLARQIEKGSFRQDLFYRINTFTLSIPPLRERKEDILPLARHFVELHAKRREAPDKRLARAAEQLLVDHDWPGNVRELRNVMERAVVLAAGDEIGPEVLSDDVKNKRDPDDTSIENHHPPLDSGRRLSPIVSLKDLERKAIVEAISQLGNNVTKAAKHLGISKATLFRKLKKYRLN